MDRKRLGELLLRLATNYRWTWSRSCRGLLLSLPGASHDVHPIETVRGLDETDLDELLSDVEFVTRARAESATLDDLSTSAPPTVAYFSMEFAVSEFVHHYAGGLGVLAGDHLKAASDAGIPLVGVGLFYGEGAFRQNLQATRQVESFDTLDPESVGISSTGITVEIPLPGRSVKAAVRRMDVGSVTLILLDTDVEGNTQPDRVITDRLYLGDARHRVDQEMVLGVGGVRALAALGYPIDVFHLNEGHAGFASLELIDREITSMGFAEAVDVVRQRLVFTTHTPVPAGIDRLDRATLEPYLDVWAQAWNLSSNEIWSLGQDPEAEDRFNMAVFCLRVSRMANGVSKLHGEVSRSLFANVTEGKGITHVTNGTHARTWTAPAVQEVFDDVLGREWASGDVTSWNRAEDVPDDVIAALRSRRNQGLIDLAAGHGAFVEPDALIVGFARRFAPYKRATLLFRDRERLVEMLHDDERPVHFLFAGKAHPANSAAKSLLEELLQFSLSDESNGRFTFIPDYNMKVGASLVSGSDIWLNNPIRRHEASGTSGEKAALNGVLNCSILDGWWAEMYDGANGWAIASSASDDPTTRDDHEAEAALAALDQARVEFFDKPQAFKGRVRHAWRTLGPQVTAARMIAEYRSKVYKI